MKIILNSKILLIALFFASLQSIAQQKVDDDNNALKIYRATSTKINALVHTKLDVKFDYAKQYLYGKEWVTLKPYAYPTDSLTLDAKGMDIKTVALVVGTKNIPLKYSYDSLELKINLDKTYKAGENYTVYIDYTAKPNELKVKGSAAINDAKGLYFINPDSAIKGKPVQIWTQGETTGSSAWFPTIDHPNQKTTEEITMTVPSKYVTLSNGALINQKKNSDGTRSDTWKMDKPHSPYLFMMAVGDFKIYHDKWKNTPVDYYLEPAYAPYAKEIFGKTPAMIDFFSKKLGIDYPWNKYAQIVVRDYVSGAMENTTATLHGDYVQQTPREMIDGRGDGELTIAHELFHQWFGDYVTAESWSNLSVNESFADFSETMWTEYAEGQDAGDAHNYSAMQAYLNSPDAKAKTLIRFNYNDKEDVFDVVSYQKGGRILNMLRNYLGEDVFFKGLNIYLTQNALGNGEAQQVRLALEQASGKDLNWFFNQWYYGAGNPNLTINYKWDEVLKTETIYFNQTQKDSVFILPMKIDVYANGKKQSNQYWMTNRTDSICYQLTSKPDLINVDADKILLVSKTDNKNMDQFAYQYKKAGLYVDRLEAMNAAIKNIKEPIAQQLLLVSLLDPYYELRIKAINAIKLDDPDLGKPAIQTVISLAKTDKNTLVRASAIESLASLNDKTYMPLFQEGIKNQSFAISGAALNGINGIDKNQAYTLSKALASSETKGDLAESIMKVYIANGNEIDFPFVQKAFSDMEVQSKLENLANYLSMLMKIENTAYVKQGVDELKGLAVRYKAYGIDKYMKVMLTNILNNKKTQLEKADAALKAELQNQIEYIQKNIDEVSDL